MELSDPKTRPKLLDFILDRMQCEGKEHFEKNGCFERHKKFRKIMDYFQNEEQI